MEQNILEIQVAIIENNPITSPEFQHPDYEEALLLSNYLLQGKYEDVLNSRPGKAVLQVNQPLLDGQSFASYILENTEGEIAQCDEGARPLREYSLLCVGISCLQLFVQNNWVGPPTSGVAHFVLPPGSVSSDEATKLQRCVSEELSMNGEVIYKQTKHLILLFLAKLILLESRKYLKKCQTSAWWLMRCLKIQQDLLEERSPILKTTILDLIAEVLLLEPLMTDDKFKDAQIQFAVEAGHICHYYYEPVAAKEHLTRAQKLANLQIELTGAMGKRTKYQMEDKAQLVLKITRPGDAQSPNLTATPDVDLSELPKDVALDDDTILNEISFTDAEVNFVTNLTPTEQSLILALCREHRRTHESVSKIMQEESMAYISTVFRQPQNWSVISTSTFLRTSWEKDSLRKSERSLSQLEELVCQFDKPSKNPAARLHLLYSVQLPPRWEIQKEQAEFLLKIGAVKGALDVFLRLEMWEEIIKCYKGLGQTEKAEKAIREQLSVQATPSLWCHLGDVLNDPDCYQKAWELSNGKYARAQRSLGYHYLYKTKFEDCIPYFEKALEINSLQIGVWFSYGCACMGCSKWADAAKAFRRCVVIDYDNFEAWNNLSTAYIRLKEKPKAFNALQEALKCEYENWRVWENYLLVSIDIGQFAEVIRSYHRLLDLKNKYSDTQVLGLLVRAVNENMIDAQNTPAGELRPKVLELFGRLTSKVTNEAEIWRLYATLLTGNQEVTQPDRERALQYLQKSLRCSTQAMGWEKDANKCTFVAEESCALANSYLEVVEKVENPTQAIQLLSSSRLMLKGNLTKIKQKHTDPVTKELLPELQEPCHILEDVLQKITSLTEHLKGR